LELVLEHIGGTNLDSDVRLAKNGDAAAFERLVQENKISMYRVAKGILKSEADVGDAVQETILKAYKGLPSLRKHAYFKTWLIKILINECNSILRRQKRIVLMGKIKPDNAGTQTDHDSAELMNAVKCLDDDLRVVTILFYFEDLPIKTISSIVNVPEGTVKSRLSRARVKLYNVLTGKEGVQNERKANR